MWSVVERLQTGSFANTDPYTDRSWSDTRSAANHAKGKQSVDQRVRSALRFRHAPI